MILSISLDGCKFFFRMNVSDAMSSLNACQGLQILRVLSTRVLTSNFAIIDQASSRFALKIKEALHILWDKPTLNAQVKHVNLKLLV